jgi:hypothetical protein
MQRPTFEDYYRLKTQGLHYRFQVSTQAMRCLTNAADGGSGFPSDQKGATKAVRAAVHSRTGQLHVPRLSAVCLDHIAAATSHTNTGWSLLKGRVAKPFTVAAEQVNPGFMYFAESGDPSGTQGDFFLLSFFAKFRDSDNVGPVFISLAWSSEDQTWALSRMLADRWLQLHTLF